MCSCRWAVVMCRHKSWPRVREFAQAGAVEALREFVWLSVVGSDMYASGVWVYEGMQVVMCM